MSYKSIEVFFFEPACVSQAQRHEVAKTLFSFKRSVFAS